MIERLQKILSARGVASRRQAETMISQGRVTCNGAVCSLGQSADPDIDVILVDGKPLPSPQEHTYIMLHKPRGYVTTLSDEKGRPDVSQLVADCGRRVYPVGRLDMDSEGLLLFTDDGELANKLMHPKHQVEKTYQVTVKGFTQEGFARLGKPMSLDGYRLRIPRLDGLSVDEKTGKARFYITIHEGRNRQVRRMCAIAQMTVIRLVRVQEGAIKLGNLPRGTWRYLSEEEIASIRE